MQQQCALPQLNMRFFAVRVIKLIKTFLIKKNRQTMTLQQTECKTYDTLEIICTTFRRKTFLRYTVAIDEKLA